MTRAPDEIRDTVAANKAAIEAAQKVIDLQGDWAKAFKYLREPK